MENKIVKGVIYGNKLVGKAEFIKAISENWEKIKQGIKDFKVALDKINTKEVNRQNSEVFFKAWEAFQKEVLDTPYQLDLMVIYRNEVNKGKVDYTEPIKMSVKIGEGTFERYSQEERQIIKETKYGIKADSDGLKNIIKEIKKDNERRDQAKALEKFLKSHLAGLYAQINSPLPSRTTKYVRQLATKEKINIIKNETTWRELIFGKRKENKVQGQIIDGFINHMAQYHDFFIPFLKGKIEIDEDQFDEKISVYKELNSQDKFAKMLKESTNTTRWYTGGDLVVVNKDGKVIYNIQIKSTTFKNPSVFGIAITELKKYINSLDSQVEQQKEVAIEELYKIFETSGIVSQEVEKQIEEIEDKTIKSVADLLT